MRLSMGVVVYLLLSCAYAGAQPPIGFERWTDPADSGVVFNQEFADLFSTYSNPAQTIHGTLFAPGVPPTPPRRLIDIEVHTAGPLAHNLVDAVWVENTAAFKLDSWLLNRMTKSRMLTWTRYRGYVMVDVERYHRNGQTYWAAILQRNLHGVDWQILTDVTIDAINATAHADDMRVIDVDFVGYGRCADRPNPGQACATVLYDAVLVKNTGANDVLWNLEEGWNYDPHVASAYQLVDREKDGSVFSFGTNWWSAYLSVAVDNEYDTHEFLTPTDVLFWHNHDFQRVIDLELDPAIGGSDPGFPSYYTVNTLP